MTVNAFPAIVPNASAWSYDGNTRVSTSFLSGFSHTQSFGGELWRVTLSFVNLTADQRATMAAFIARMNGAQNRVLLPMHGQSNRGAFGGTPVVDGANQAGTQLDIDGASLSVTNWIREGDVFAIDNELKIATEDAHSDALGRVQLRFRPRLRASPADNAPIVTSAATGLFLLAPEPNQWSMRPGGFSDLTLNFVEALQ